MINQTFIVVFIDKLANTEEYIDGNRTGNLGEVLIRFVCVVYFNIKETGIVFFHSVQCKFL